MKYLKDILIIDFETTGGGPVIAEPLQIGAVLLDKETLEEKENFNSYITGDASKITSQAFKKHGITTEMLNNAPSIDEVGKIFVEKFGFDVILASFAANLDISMLRKMISAAEINYEYDYHILDIWPLAYTMVVKKGKPEIYRSEEIFNFFKLPSRDKHDALEDCRLTAELLRKII